MGQYETTRNDRPSPNSSLTVGPRRIRKDILERRQKREERNEQIAQWQTSYLDDKLVDICIENTTLRVDVRRQALCHEVSRVETLCRLVPRSNESKKEEITAIEGIEASEVSADNQYDFS